MDGLLQIFVFLRQQNKHVFLRQQNKNTKQELLPYKNTCSKRYT